MEQKPLSMQIYVNTGTNANVGTCNYSVNLPSGQYRVKLMGLQIQFQTDPTYIQLQLQSPHLQIRYGNEKYPIISYPIAAHIFRMSNSYIFETNIMNGIFPLQILDYATKDIPTNFMYAILNFEVTPI